VIFTLDFYGGAAGVTVGGPGKLLEEILHAASGVPHCRPEDRTGAGRVRGNQPTRESCTEIGPEPA
jgi:hypothetical protein